MNCPVCKRDNAFTLSICPSCGTMINDSVREELVAKVTPTFKPIPKPEYLDLQGDFHVQNKPNGSQRGPLMKSQTNFDVSHEPEFRKENPDTADFTVKNTSPTLVEFQNKNAKLPEWRLQLKNAVLQRNTGSAADSDSETFTRSIEMADSPSMRRMNLATSGANALKVEEVSETSTDYPANPKLAAALKRIEKSRKRFLKVEQPEELTFGSPAKPNNSLLYFTAKPNDHLPLASSSVRFETGGGTVTSFRSNDEKLDTNKLPPLPKAAQISSSFGQNTFASELVEGNFGAQQLELDEIVPEIVEPVEAAETEVEIEDLELQEIDDCAPIAMRFNSGLFDLIIGSFASLLLLVPFMSFGGAWFGLAGVLAFTATTSIVMFIYLTTAVALYGRTFGMKLFSLEIIDIEGEEYPTIHQAAVSSSVYLISILFAGAGFLTMFFNDENRAAHDLISRTIVVREF